MSAVADELRQEVSRLREIVREQGETIKEQNDRIDELERENTESTENETKDAQDLVEVRTDEKVAELDDVWIAGLPFGKVLNAVRTTIREDGGLIDRIIDLEDGSVGSGETPESNDGRSPLAQLIDLPAETANDALTANQERGRRIAQRAEELGKNTPEGFVVQSSDIATQLKKWGESTHSETVSRVMDFIIDLGKNDVRSTMHKGKRILVFDPDRVKGYGSGAEPEVIKSRRDVIWSRENSPDPAPA
jgi:gas vesicle protein